MKNLSTSRFHSAKCLLVITFIGFYAFAAWRTPPFSGHLPAVEAQTGKPTPTPYERFDNLVRDDFFAGMLGDIVNHQSAFGKGTAGHSAGPGTRDSYKRVRKAKKACSAFACR
jgi:hypothetical protein